MTNLTIYRNQEGWKKFLSSEDSDKVANTVSVLSSQLQETVVIVAENPEENVIHLVFNKSVPLPENEDLYV